MLSPSLVYHSMSKCRMEASSLTSYDLFIQKKHPLSWKFGVILPKSLGIGEWAVEMRFPPEEDNANLVVVSTGNVESQGAWHGQTHTEWATEELQDLNRGYGKGGAWYYQHTRARECWYDERLANPATRASNSASRSTTIQHPRLSTSPFRFNSKPRCEYRFSNHESSTTKHITLSYWQCCNNNEYRTSTQQQQRHYRRFPAQNPSTDMGVLCRD